MKTKTVYVCQNCNSDNVEVKAWVKPNNNNEYQEEVGEALGWCCDEKLLKVIETEEFNEDAKVIGFQVVGKYDTAQKDQIHPDMDGLFCVYSLKQAQKMLNKENDSSYVQWQLLAIWDTDIEKPQMMFSGNPRD